MNFKIKTVSLFCLTILSIATLVAQENTQKSDFWDNVRFGGGLGLSTGNRVFSATLAPSAIYDFNTSFSLGLGLNGTYLSQRDVFKSTILGARIISLYNPWQAIQLSGEFEQNHVSRNFDNPDSLDDKFWVPAFYIGAGYRTRNVTVGIRYDFLYDEAKSITASAWVPFVRVFF